MLLVSVGGLCVHMISRDEMHYFHNGVLSIVLLVCRGYCESLGSRHVQ